LARPEGADLAKSKPLGADHAELLVSP